MLKSKLLKYGAMASVAVASLATTAGTFAFSGTITDNLSVADKAIVEDVMDKAVAGAVSAGYTSVNFLLTYGTQEAIISIIVAIGLIYFGGGWAISWVKSIFTGRKSKKSGVK